MTEQTPRPLPTARWRRVLEATGVDDVAAVVSLALIATGVIMLWGLAIMLLVLGIIGAGGVVTFHAVQNAAARSDR